MNRQMMTWSKMPGWRETASLSTLGMSSAPVTLFRRLSLITGMVGHPTGTPAVDLDDTEGHGAEPVGMEQVMNLEGRDGQRVSLTPVGYEFPIETSDVWISSCLLIEGQAVASDGQWTFRGGVMTTWEGQGLGQWLLDAARGRLPVTGDEYDTTLTFTEPSLALSIASQGDDGVHLRVHLTHVCAPPWLDIDDQMNTYSYSVKLAIAPLDLETATATWMRELAAFPIRGDWPPGTS